MNKSGNLTIGGTTDVYQLDVQGTNGNLRLAGLSNQIVGKPIGSTYSTTISLTSPGTGNGTAIIPDLSGLTTNILMDAAAWHASGNACTFDWLVSSDDFKIYSIPMY